MPRRDSAKKAPTVRAAGECALTSGRRRSSAEEKPEGPPKAAPHAGYVSVRSLSLDKRSDAKRADIVHRRSISVDPLAGAVGQEECRLGRPCCGWSTAH